VVWKVTETLSHKCQQKLYIIYVALSFLNFFAFNYSQYILTFNVFIFPCDRRQKSANLVNSKLFHRSKYQLKPLVLLNIMYYGVLWIRVRLKHTATVNLTAEQTSCTVHCRLFHPSGTVHPSVTDKSSGWIKNPQWQHKTAIFMIAIT